MQNKFASEDFSLLLTNDGDLFLKFLFDKYYQELCRLSFRYVGRSDISEDIVQEVFINIWNKKQSLNYNGCIKPCLIRSVINASLNYIKSKYGRQNFEDDSKLDSLETGLVQHEDISSRELEKLLEIAVGQLPGRCREIFAMSRFSGLSHKEIAESLDISTKTIEAQITIALKKIHRFLSQAGYFPLIIFFQIIFCIV